MKMPVGLVPQRSNVVPSLRVLTEDVKLQVPTSRPAIESGGCDGKAPALDGIAAAAMPISAMNSRLSKRRSPQSIFYGLYDTARHADARIAAVCMHCSNQYRLPVLIVTNAGLASESRGLQAFGGVKRRQHDALITGAATEIAGDGNPHLPFSRVRIIAQKFQ